MAGVAPKPAPKAIYKLPTVFESARSGLKSYIDSHPTSNKIGIMQKHAKILEDIYQILTDNNADFLRQYNDFNDKLRSLYMEFGDVDIPFENAPLCILKPLLGICNMFLTKLHEYKLLKATEEKEAASQDDDEDDEDDEKKEQIINRGLNNLPTYISDIQFAIDQHFRKHTCSKQDEAEYEQIINIANKKNKKGKPIMEWYNRIEPNSPAWFKIDINGKIEIYSYNLKKWICAHPIYHAFAYNFVVRHNIPFNATIIVWPDGKPSASVGFQSKQESEVEKKLRTLKEYFENVNVNPLESDSSISIMKHLTDFRDNVRLFISLLDDTNIDEREVKKFLTMLDNDKVFMTHIFPNQIKFLMANDKKTEYEPPEYNIEHDRRDFTKATNAFKKIQNNINARKKVNPNNKTIQIPAENQKTFNTFTTKFIIAKYKFDIYKFIKIKLNKIGKNDPNPYSTSVTKPIQSQAAMNNAALRAAAMNNKAAAATAKKEGTNALRQMGRAAFDSATFDGGARKYPAKKYRFASRKHSKRCKTTSHKKACRRKSHKHRRITRKR